MKISRGVISAIFVGSLLALCLIFGIFYERLVAEDANRVGLIFFGPIASIGTHWWLIGGLLGALPVWVLTLLVFESKRFGYLALSAAIVLWIAEGFIFSMGY